MEGLKAKKIVDERERPPSDGFRRIVHEKLHGLSSQQSQPMAGAVPTRTEAHSQLWQAVRNQNPENVEELLRSKVQALPGENLLIAVLGTPPTGVKTVDRQRRLDVVKKVLAHGAKVNDKDSLSEFLP